MLRCFLRFALACCVIGPCGSLAALDPPQLRVLSYNIHHGEGVDGQQNLGRIAHVIKSVNADLVALQELDQSTERTRQIDQPAELARLTSLNVAFGPNIQFQGGHYGNAVLSRFPIRRFENHLLPSHRSGEQRGVLQTEIDVPGLTSPLVFFATHLDARPGDSERIASAKAIKALGAKMAEQPLLLAGDLNDVPGSKALGEITAFWKRANDQIMPTVPVVSPKRQIDYVLFHPASRWTVVEVRVLDERVASDHLPLLATLRLVSNDAEK